MTATIINVPFSAIVFDSATQIRAEINNDAVAEYSEAMATGSAFPPVELFADAIGAKAKYYIGDGWHRLLAYQANGDVTVPAVVHVGGRDRAIKFALSANARHGMRRTNADKRRAVEVALREFGNLSDRQIAEICAVSDKTVAAQRKGNCGNSAVEARMGADGKIRKMPVAAMKHEPCGEVEREPSKADEKPAIGGTLADIQDTARTITPGERVSDVKLSRGLMVARAAIAHLETIQPNDKEYRAAMELVHEWIQARIQPASK